MMIRDAFADLDVEKSGCAPWDSFYKWLAPDQSGTGDGDDESGPGSMSGNGDGDDESGSMSGHGV